MFSRNDLVVEQFSSLLHVEAVDVHDMIARDHVALLIDAKAPIGVAVISESDIEALVHDELLQMLYMCGAAVCVDVIAIRLIVHNICLCSESVEYALRDRPCRAVRDVEADLDILETELGHRDEVSDVAVTSADVVYSASDLFAFCHRNFHLAVDVLLDLQKSFFVHLLAVVVDDLDAVVVVRIMRSRDHDAAVEIVDSGDVRYRRSRRNVHDVGVSTRCHEARAQRVLKHVAGSSCILSDDHLCLAVKSLAVVPAEITADLDGVIECQRLVGFAAEAVCSEIFAHYSLSFFSISRKYLYVSTVSSPQASSSHAMMAPLCICRALQVHFWLTPPSTTAAMALALL